MAYPLSESFSTAPASTYLTTLGSMTAGHNSAQQAIDLSAPNSQSILRFNETAHGDFWFEADVELLTDPSARRHVGLWMTTGNGAEGYRFAHLDGTWSVSRWSSGFGDGAGVTGGLNDGASPMAYLAELAPSFNVGERRRLRCEVIVGALDANAVPWARLIQFKVDGVPMFQVGDLVYRGKLIPGVFLYGATARVHAIAGDTPSGLPSFPEAVSVSRAGDRAPLFSPASARWNSAGPCDRIGRSIPAGRENIHFGGKGWIAGTVKEKGEPDRPLARQVLLYSENTRLLVAATWSDATGQYRFDGLDATQRYTVMSYDHTHLYRAVLADNLAPESIP